MKKGFTLIEMVLTIVISSILTIGTIIALKKIYMKGLKTKYISTLSLETQIVADKIALMLYDRIPSSALGYDPLINNYKSIYDINSSDNMKIFEWYGENVDVKNRYGYSGFIDIDKCSRSGGIINTPIFDSTKFTNLTDNVIIMAGSYDMGEEITNFNNSFGWHGEINSSEVLEIVSASGNNVTVTATPNLPTRIYEKYYLANQAFAIARGADINPSIINSGNCNIDVGFDLNDIDNFENSLFLFYGYKPWKGETFCGDPNNNGIRRGGVALLGEDVSGFNVLITPSGELKFSISLEGNLRGEDRNITISKQKVIL